MLLWIFVLECGGVVQVVLQLDFDEWLDEVYVEYVLKEKDDVVEVNEYEVFEKVCQMK